MDILISGAGIAGTTLAYWLHRNGFRPTLLERAPAFRSGGYVVDFWGAGFDVAEKMGIVPALRAQGYSVKEVRFVDEHGARSGGFGAEVFERMTHGRYTSIPRGDLAEAIYAALDPGIERIFGDEVVALNDTPRGIGVTLQHGGKRRFDLVIGADGLHSHTRSMVFGPQEQFEKYMGYEVAAFSVEGYPKRDEDVYVLFSEKGGQVGRFTMRDNRTLFLFVWASDDSSALPTAPEAQIERVRARFGKSAWECPAILDAIQGCRFTYLDRVSQIRMNSWTKGRVALLGDAAHCASLLAGQGSALAMIGAYILAGELRAANGKHTEAFSRYEERLGGFLHHKQQAAERFASSFAPRSDLGIWFRNQVTNLFSIPWVADLAIGRDLRDEIELPEYALRFLAAAPCRCPPQDQQAQQASCAVGCWAVVAASALGGGLLAAVR